jgi:hypothetical protein
MSRDRDELFAVLALHLRLIDLKQLAACIEVYNNTMGKALAEVMTGQGVLDEKTRAALEGLEQILLERVGNGKPEECIAKIGMDEDTRRLLLTLKMDENLSMGTLLEWSPFEGKEEDLAPPPPEA